MATKTATANGQTLLALVATDTTYSSGGFSGVILDFSDPSVNPPVNTTTNVNSLVLTLADPAVDTIANGSVFFGTTSVALQLDRITGVKGSAGDDLIGYTATAPRNGTAYTVYASEGNDSYNLYGNSTLTYAGYGAGLTVNVKFGSVTGKLNGSGDAINTTPDHLVLTSYDDTVTLSATKTTDVDGGGNTTAGDTLSWSTFSATGVTVSLDNGTDSAGNTFSNFENFKGSAGDDLFAASTDTSPYTLLATEGNDSYQVNSSGKLSYAAYTPTVSATVGLNFNLKFGSVTGKTGGTSDAINGALAGLTGTSLNDTFVVSTLAGHVIGKVDGGAGTDTLSFGSVAAATVDIDAGTATGISGTFASIEKFIGSAGNDSFTDVSVTGFVIAASLGNDTYSLNGKGTLTYAGTTSPLTIDLSAGTVTGKASAGHDSISGLAPSLVGSNGNDDFTAASTGNETLDGGLGNDVLHLGGNKADYFFTNNNDGSGILSKVGQTITFSHFESIVFADGTAALSTAPQDDFFGAGRSATFWRAADGDVWIWNNNGTAVDAYTHTVGQVDPVWNVVGIGDLGGDGKADVVFHNSTNGEVYMWNMNGGSISTQGDVTSAGLPVFLDPAVWQGLGVRDFDGDGFADVLWQQKAGGPNPGQVYEWSMNGSTISSQGVVGNAPTGSTLLGFGDVNGDNHSDVIWYNSTTNQVQYWFMSGHDKTTGAINVASNLHVKGVGDFNGDGITDLLTQTTSGTVVIATLSKDADGVGNGSIVGQDPVATVDPSLWTIKQVNDYNGDGNADILFTSSTGDVWVWEMDGASIIGQGSAGHIDLSANWTLYA